MIYVRADDQNDPHSEINVECKGTWHLIGNEAGALMNEIYKVNPDMFHSIVRAVICQHVEDFRRLVNE